MTHSNEVLSRLRGIVLEDLTVAQMNSVLGPSSISPNINGQFEQAQMVADALAAQRTYAHGMAIPELSVVTSSGVVPSGQVYDFQPSGTEVWEVIGLDGTSESSTVSTLVVLTDGSNFVVTHSPYDVTTGGAQHIPL